MASGVNDPKPLPSAAAASAAASSLAAAAAAAATSSIFIPPADPTIGTWLSLGSYEEVFNSDWDYWEVTKALKNGGMKLVKILKIHNSHLKDRFDEEEKIVRKGRNTGFDADIQHLYHGTSENLERICHEGLDERLSSYGHFGRGIYFSDNPAFCRIHSEEKSPPNPFIVRCKVILGDCKVYPPGSSDPGLTREPVKTTVNGKNVFYDSVKGKSGDFTQYVIYEKRCALIQYVIYYTADGPLPSLPPIPSPASKSTKKRRPKSKERKRSTSPHSSDSRRHSSASSGDEKGRRRSGSVSSLDLCYSRKSSDADSIKDDDDMGACCSKVSVDKPEKIEVVPQPVVDSVSEVPKFHTMRARTRRLLNSDSSFASATASSSATGAVADTSLPRAASAAEFTSLPISVANAATGSSSLPSVDPSGDAYKKMVQDNAMKQMLDLKGKLSTREMEELFNCYSQTYGGVDPRSAQDLSSDTIPSGSNDIQMVIDVLVVQFQNIVDNIDPAVARRYITQFDMDLDRAINAYFEDNMKL